MTDADALMAAVLAAPADDLPRLMLADELYAAGDTARAEFVQVQIELARTPPWVKRNRLMHEIEWQDYRRASRIGERFELTRPADRIGVLTYEEPNPKHRELEDREAELFTAHGAAWFGPHATVSPPNGRECEAGGVFQIVERGFVGRVTAPIAWFWDAIGGGACNGCSGNAGYYVAANGDIHLSDPDYTMQDSWRRCEACDGTGREIVPGPPPAFVALARSQPVQWVEPTDVVVFPSGGNDTYFLGGLGSFPQDWWSQLENHKTRFDVRAALSRLLLAAARGGAG